MMLEEEIRSAMVADAKARYPKEACGVVVIANGKQEYISCDNVHPEPEDAFAIDPYALVNAEKRGEVKAYFHSHPDTSCTPSKSDIASCDKSELPWVILSIPGEEWHYQMPSLKKLPIYGREFIHGVNDCYSFVKDWYAEELGVTLPEPLREDDWWRKGQNLYLDNYEAAGFVKVDSSDLQRGDIILMQVHSDVPNHAAVFLGDNLIGHHLYHRLSKKDVYGGYWLKHTYCVLRYVSK